MSTSLSDKVDRLFEEQLAEWPLAAANYKALDNVELKEFELSGMPIKAQFNPARAVSSSAKVDAASVKARKCFLCEENRPAKQRGIIWQDKYVILVNPYPIFRRHLTIPDLTHTDQRIDGRIADMMRLAYELEGYTVFYNGPRCGASAPDHMHFQAGNSDFLTISEALEHTELKEIATDGESTLSLADKLPIRVFVIDAANPEEGQSLFSRLYKALPVPEGEAEPMMNILAFATPAGVRLVVIPRKRHRPSFYGTEGDDCMLLSPASVDMGGVFITPRPQDFARLDAATVLRVLNELCLSETEINNIATNVE